jgi:hypothetical protein
MPLVVQSHVVTRIIHFLGRLTSLRRLLASPGLPEPTGKRLKGLKGVLSLRRKLLPYVFGHPLNLKVLHSHGPPTRPG